MLADDRRRRAPLGEEFIGDVDADESPGTGDKDQDPSVGRVLCYAWHGRNEFTTVG